MLQYHDLIHLETVAQDGMRVRASAGSSSFRTQKSLEESRKAAETYLEQLKQESDDDDDRQRISARHQYPVCQRRCAMVIACVDVTSDGSDASLLHPMYQDLCDRYGVVPEKYLADGGFSKKEGVTQLERNGTRFYGPLHNEKKQLAEDKDPYAARSGENSYYTAFRQRMGTAEAKEIYRRRSAAAEFPNAVCRNQGLTQFSVRGLIKAKSQALWHALAYNFRRFTNLKVGCTDKTYLEVLMAS